MGRRCETMVHTKQLRQKWLQKVVASRRWKWLVVSFQGVLSGQQTHTSKASALRRWFNTIGRESIRKHGICCDQHVQKLSSVSNTVWRPAQKRFVDPIYTWHTDDFRHPQRNQAPAAQTVKDSGRGKLVMAQRITQDIIVIRRRSIIFQLSVGTPGEVCNDFKTIT